MGGPLLGYVGSPCAVSLLSVLVPLIVYLAVAVAYLPHFVRLAAVLWQASSINQCSPSGGALGPQGGAPSLGFCGV